MKRIFLLLLLVLSLNFANAQQKQFRRIYTEVAVTKGDDTKRIDAVNTIFFNYGNRAVLKIYSSDNTITFYDQVTDIDEGKTSGGMVFQSAVYRQRGTGLEIGLQMFDEAKYGCRIVFSDESMIQFLP
jgi:hypothetical protein